MSDDKLPKQDLLLKIMNMTTVAEDTVALVALRRANKLLEEAGWSWEKLLLGKIVVVADPFSNIQAPPKKEESPYSSASSIPPRPQPARPKPTPQAAFTPAFTRPRPIRNSAPQTDYDWGTKSPASAPSSSAGGATLGSKPNKYPGFCFCCGDHVPVTTGVVFNPKDHNSAAADKWSIACAPCNRSKPRVQMSPARRNTPLHPSVDPALQGAAPKLGDL